MRLGPRHDRCARPSLRRQREATDQAANQPTDAAATTAASTSESAAAPAGAAAAAQPATPTATPTSTQPVDDADTGIAEDAAFEAARATLLERLDNFEAPPGTSPEDAAALRQELADAVEALPTTPRAEHRGGAGGDPRHFDDRVQDFVQDQKIETLVREVEEDNQAEAAAEAAPRTPRSSRPRLPRRRTLRPRRPHCDPGGHCDRCGPRRPRCPRRRRLGSRYPDARHSGPRTRQPLMPR